jgi:hypothetical protein
VTFRRAPPLVVAQGGVMVVTRDQVISTPELTLDPATGALVAAGPVTVVTRSEVMTCSSATLRLPAGDGILTGVRIETREPMDAATREEVARHGVATPGRRLALLTGRRVTLAGPSRLTVEDATLTTCDCAQGPSPWSVRATRADVRVGDRAVVWLPVVNIMDIPVLALPAWVVPLGNRVTGLLVPEVRFQDGLWLAQPLYATVGEHADVTVTPGLVLQRGPRLAVEGRAAPRRESYVEGSVTYQHDRKHLRQRGTLDRWGHAPSWLEEPLALGTSRTEAGERLVADRLAARFLARSRVGPASLSADAAFASDKHVPGDFGASLGDRVAPYLRSGAALSLARRHAVFALSVATFQDLLQPDVLLWGRRSARLAHRVPALRLRLVETPLVTLPVLGTVLAGRGEAGVDHELVLGSGHTREAWNQQGRVPGALRIALAPEVVAPLRLGRFLGARGSLALREALLVSPGGAVEDVTRLTSSVFLETELTGRFLGGGGPVHRWRPRLGYQGAWWLRSSARGASPWLDVEDRAGRFHVLLAEVENHVVVGSVAGRRVTVGLDGRWAADLHDPGRQEATARFNLHAGDADARARIAVDPVTRDVTFAQGSLDVGGGPGPRVHVGYTRVGARVPRFMAAGADDVLGGLRWEGPVTPGGADRLDALVAVPAGPVVADYGFEAALGGGDLRLAPGLGRRLTDVKPVVLTHGGGVTYVSPCHCWQAGARLRFWPNRQVPDVAVVVSLQGPHGEVGALR